MLADNKNSGCPFRGLEPCDSKCALFRSGIIYTDELRTKAEPFQDCAINIMCNNMEMMHHRVYQNQAETGQMKNALVMKLMFDMGMREEKDVKQTLARTIEIGTDEKRKLLEDNKE